ncbi:MAG: ABC transporter substrate-binding protein [Alphaproteobacteria bacterium]|nr:ABC transporter substrate-binding protein [Alphaproteobacteria bacterium]
MTRRAFIALLAATLFAFPGAPARAQNAAPDAKAFIDRLAQRAIEGLTAKDIDAADRAQRFRELFTETFDVPVIGRFALGTPWRTASEADRTAYLKAFEDYIVATYATRFADYGGEKIRTTGSRKGEDDEVFVSSEFARAQGAPVRVVWRLRPVKDSWRIIDVIIEDVSMAITQRDDFTATIQRNGGKLSALIDALKSKTVTAGKS